MNVNGANLRDPVTIRDEQVLCTIWVLAVQLLLSLLELLGGWFLDASRLLQGSERITRASD